MGIRFSEIKLSDPSGRTIQKLVSGHPDKDNLLGNRDIRDIAFHFDFPIHVIVQQYYYLADANEVDADKHHFSIIHTNETDADDHHLDIIRAYDELAEMRNNLSPKPQVGLFTDRDDVWFGENFTFMLEEAFRC